MSSESIADAVEGTYGLHGSVQRVAGENENYLIETPDGEKFVLKLASEGTTRERIHMEHTMMQALLESDLGVALPQYVPDRSGNLMTSLKIDDGPAQLARLLAFIPGEPWGEKAPASTELLYALGKLIAGVAEVFSPLDLPEARKSHNWDLTAAEAHRSEVNLIPDPVRRRLAVLQFERLAASAQDLATVPHGLIHGDLNDEHLLIKDGQIAGILDFGDALHNPLICDLAISLTYVLLYEPDQWTAGAQVVSGYHTERPLTRMEIELLYPLICGRLGTSHSPPCGQSQHT